MRESVIRSPAVLLCTTLVPHDPLKHMRKLVAEPKWQTPAQRELGVRLIERTRLHNP